MVAAFPIAKLGALVIKQVSKPLANVVKARAKSSPFFRTYICMPPAQFYHWCEVKMKMWSMNLGKPVNIPKLNENMAIDLGAELLGEGVIFLIAAGILINEYMRSARKEAAKEEARLDEMIRVQTELKELYFAKAKHEAQIRELVRILHVNLPAIEIRMPSNISVEGIPEHHRHAYAEVEHTGVWTSMKGLVWNAIDILLPPVENGEGPGSASSQGLTKPIDNSTSSKPGPSSGPSSTNKGTPSPSSSPSSQTSNTKEPAKKS